MRGRILAALLVGACLLGAAPPVALGAARPDAGEGIPLQTMKPWPVETKDSGGTLIFSDSPEYLKEYGILYQDTVKGEARVFYYHLNDSRAPGKLAVVLRGEEAGRVQVEITRSALAEPGSNYSQVGKETAFFYMRQPQPVRKLTLTGGRGLLLTPEMEVPLRPGHLASGMYDLKASGKVRVTVLFCPPQDDPVAFAERAQVLPRDREALRGTFQGMNRTLKAKRAYDPQKDGLVYIPIGDNRHDRFKQGVDATDGAAVENFGNYGVLYELKLPTRGGKGVRFMLSPLGGTYAGVVRVKHKEGDRLVETPTGRLLFGEQTPGDVFVERGGKAYLTPHFELADLGRYAAWKRFALEYTPPGASNLPVLLIIAPGDGRGMP